MIKLYLFRELSDVAFKVLIGFGPCPRGLVQCRVAIVLLGFNIGPLLYLQCPIRSDI